LWHLADRRQRRIPLEGKRQQFDAFLSITVGPYYHSKLASIEHGAKYREPINVGIISFSDLGDEN
jgi:hypothetical protein